MPDWLIVYLGSLQGGGVMRDLAAELRVGGIGTIALAFTLGAVHALTPGHGKAALAAYFLGREAPIAKGLRVALVAAFLHVLSGFIVFLVLRVLVGQLPTISGRPSSTFMAIMRLTNPRVSHTLSVHDRHGVAAWLPSTPLNSRPLITLFQMTAASANSA